MKRRINSIIAITMTALLLATDVGNIPVVWAAEPKETNEEAGKDEMLIMNEERADDDAVGENEEPELTEFEDLGDVQYQYYKPYYDATYELKYYVMDDATICIAGIEGTDSGELVIPGTIAGKSVTTIGERAFQECKGFVGSLTIPNSVLTIGRWAFLKCSGFTGSLEISNSVMEIGYCAFDSCSGFTGSLIIPDSVKTLGTHAFEGCSGFTGSLTISNSVTTIGDWVFHGCSGFTGSLTIPNSVTEIGYCAFESCSGFTGSLTIPDSVKTIGIDAFSGCSGFTGSLTIPNSVTTIGDRAFYECSGFTGDLTIPDSVTRIGDKVFVECSGFTGSLTIPDSVTEIGIYAFYNCSGLIGSLTIPDSVTKIGNFAFGYCSGFTGSLTIPNSVTEIGDGAFCYCSGFSENLTFPDGVTTIGGSAFAGCNGFTGSLTIPDSVTKIGVRAFLGCSGFTGSPTIPNSVTEIENGIFEGCSGFTGSLTIPNSVTKIGSGVFKDCSGITGSLTIPEGVKSLGYDMIAGTGISSVTIPSTVTSSSYWKYSEAGAFTGCDTLKEVVFTEGIVKIPDYICYGAGSIEKVVIPPSVIEIGSNSFNKCDKITIYCTAGSYAEQYAKENNIPYVTDAGNEPAIESITLSKTELSLKTDEEYELSATITPIEAAGAALTWDSNNKEVVTISGGGTKVKIKAVGVGTAKVTVCAENGIKATCDITVASKGSVSGNEPAVESITLSKTKLSLKTDEEYELSATITPAEAAGAALTWDSNNEKVVTISGDGTKVKIKAVGEGTAKITVSAENGIKATCEITVTTEGSVSDNSPMNPVIPFCEDTTEIHLVKGQKFTIAESGWVSSDKKILSISKTNQMTAKRVTSTPVKLTKAGRSIDVYITQPKMIAKSITMQVGSTQSIGFNYDSDNLNVQWYCNTPDIATVSEDGEVLAVGKGTATITAFINGSAYSCKIKVLEDLPAVERTIHMNLNNKKTISIKGVKKVAWVSDDEKVASVTKKNKVTAIAIGETVLRTEYEGKEYRIKIYVEDTTITSKSIQSAGKNKYTVTLSPGATTGIKFASIDQQVIFKSSKGEVAYVDADGTIVTNRAGKAKLTAKVNGKTITITVTVK